MRVKIIFILIVFVWTLTLNVSNIYASPGALRKNSIKPCSDGLNYGYHGDGNGGTHWHVAEAHSEMSSGWAAVGEPIATDPCPDYNVSNTIQTNSINNYYTNTTNNIAINTISNVVAKKSNDTGISKIVINYDIIEKISDIMEYVSKTKKVDIKVTTNDKKATYEIIGDIQDLSKDKVNEISIIVTAEDGTQKTYILNITRKNVESSVRIRTLSINQKSVYIDYKDNIDKVSLPSDQEKLNIEYELTTNNAKLVIIKDGQEVENGSDIQVGVNNYQLKIIDEDDNEFIYELTIEKMSQSEEITNMLLGGAVTAGGISTYVIYKKRKKSNIT